MNKRNVFIGVVFMVILSFIIFSVVKNKKDVVGGIQPMEESGIGWRTEIIDSLRKLPQDQRAGFIQQNVPQLNSQLIRFLRNSGYDCNVDSVTYLFGSGKAKGVQSGDGNTYNGYYDEQLYAVIKGETCFKDSLVVFVQCLNGTFSLKGKTVQNLGSYKPRFTIEKGNGINAYVDYQTSIFLAEHFKLPVYVGRNPGIRKRISYQMAKDLEAHLGRKQVTVLVYPGDEFDLGTMTYVRLNPF